MKVFPLVSSVFFVSLKTYKLMIVMIVLLFQKSFLKKTGKVLRTGKKKLEKSVYEQVVSLLNISLKTFLCKYRGLKKWKRKPKLTSFNIKLNNLTNAFSCILGMCWLKFSFRNSLVMQMCRY